MAHQWLATILGVTSLFPNSDAVLFSYPFDNGIRVLGFDDLLGSEAVYYGDEIDLKFWKLLKMPFGQSNDPENPLTLQEGYLYKYYHKTKIFDVFDENGTRIVHKENVRTIAQMNIDFTIHKSHQFWIIADANMDGHIFMFPAILRKDQKPIDVEEFMQGGVQNIYVPDRVRPYLPEDLDNPEWAIKYLAIYDRIGFARFSSLGGNGYSDNYTGMGDYNIINWDKNYPTNYFYDKGTNEFEVHYEMDIKEAKMFGMLTLLYMQLGIGMYPDLMPVLRYDETQNNRPIYEPWLIWGFYKFLWNKKTNDWGDDEIPPLFDLSPSFA